MPSKDTRPFVAKVKETVRELIEEIHTARSNGDITLEGELSARRRILEEAMAEAVALGRPKKSIFISGEIAGTGKVKHKGDYLTWAVDLTEQRGFYVELGESPDAYSTPAEMVTEKIRRCTFFMSILTPRLIGQTLLRVPAPWLMLEQGIAVAFRRKIFCVHENQIISEYLSPAHRGEFRYPFTDLATLKKAVQTALDRIEVEYDNL